MIRPRVLVTTPDFPPAKGGVQRLVGELVSHATGWDTRVVTLDHPEAGRGSSLVPTRRVANRPALRQARMVQLNVATVREGLVWRPDAVVCGHIVASPGTLLLGELLRVPTVQYVYAKELPGHAALARIAMTHSTATVALSHHAAEAARQAGADPWRLSVIPPGVAVAERFLTRAAKAEVPTILTVARLADHYKGFDVMLRAMPLVLARVPAARWVVIGEGPLRVELERTAQAWALDSSVLFCGRVSDEELDQWFAHCHVFAMPSRLPADGAGEGYGLVYLEAGAHGLPCVAGNVGAVAEAVIDGETGLLVDPTDHVATAGALVELLLDTNRAAALGACGRERARTLSWERMATAVETLVADLLASRT